jgi:hypothetical protein
VNNLLYNHDGKSYPFFAMQRGSEMAEKVDVRLGGKSPEEVAYQLMSDVFLAEGRAAFDRKDRNYILNTFSECLHAVRGFRNHEERAAKS